MLIKIFRENVKFPQFFIYELGATEKDNRFCQKVALSKIYFVPG